MPRITFPDIPKVPGVPSLPRSSVSNAIARSVLGAVQGALWRVLQVQTRWGVYDAQGRPLADPGIFGGPLGTFGGMTLSTGAVDYSKETKVSDFPVERGTFASYNKVESAATPTVTLHMSGSEDERKDFLEAVDRACKSLDLFSVVTPEVTYIDYTIERYSYQRRSASGATLLTVELTLKEVRQVSSAYSISTLVKLPQDVSATPSVDNGKVQAKAPDVSTLKGIANKLPELAGKVGELLQGR